MRPISICVLVEEASQPLIKSSEYPRPAVAETTFHPAISVTGQYTLHSWPPAATSINSRPHGHGRRALLITSGQRLLRIVIFGNIQRVFSHACQYSVDASPQSEPQHPQLASPARPRPARGHPATPNTHCKVGNSSRSSYSTYFPSEKARRLCI